MGQNLSHLDRADLNLWDWTRLVSDVERCGSPLRLLLGSEQDNGDPASA
jgi:hypothetical protein